VEEFGFGFPPRILSFKRGETEFSLNLIPFGGFVKIFGELGDHKDSSRSFSGLKISKRAKIISAGVFMNLVLAFVLLSFVDLIGKPMIITEDNAAYARNIQLRILETAKDSPAFSAGLKSGDIVSELSFNGKSQIVSDYDIFKKIVDEANGNEVLIKIKRGSESIDFKITPRINPPENEGAIGVSLAQVGLVKSKWYLFLWDGLKDTATLFWLIISSLFLLLKTLIFEGRMMGELAGPIGIATITGQAYSMGLPYLMNLIALLSIHLAILNFLPFPALDGGRMVFLVFEKLRGRPVSEKIEQAVNLSGFVLLLMLMAFITWKDIAKLF
jgi:regulator of sigma E protease